MALDPTLPLIAWAEAHLGRHGFTKVATNTWLYYDRPTGEYRVKLHDTDVVSILSDTRVRVSSGGYHTRVTADRIDTFTRLLGARVGLSHGRLLISSAHSLPENLSDDTVVEARALPAARP